MGCSDQEIVTLAHLADFRNVLTPEEIAFYEAMINTGNVVVQTESNPTFYITNWSMRQNCLAIFEHYQTEEREYIATPWGKIKFKG